MQNSGEIVYGVCLPATGFSALFVVISLITVISILVSGFVCYQRQLQKVAEEAAPKSSPPQVRSKTHYSIYVHFVGTNTLNANCIF